MGPPIKREIENLRFLYLWDGFRIFTALDTIFLVDVVKFMSTTDVGVANILK